MYVWYDKTTFPGHASMRGGGGGLASTILGYKSIYFSQPRWAGP